MSDEFKKILISVAVTFSSTFLTVFGASIMTTGSVAWSFGFVGALLVSAIRAGIKAIIDQGVPIRLGGKKV